MTEEKSLLKCSHCTKEFRYDSERRRHEQSHFPQFQCKVCSKNFSFISALRRHEKQHERTGNVTCDDCGREFRDQVLLKRHTKYAHGGSYRCTKCDTIFCSEPALRSHMQTHKLESERRYQCSFEGCGKKFNFAHHLKHHELTHTNTKQHYCKICGKGFIQSHHLKAHLKTHSVESSLYCTIPNCNKKFATEYAKKRHVAKYHSKTDSGISSDSNSANDTSKPNITIPKTTDDEIPLHVNGITKSEHESQSAILIRNGVTEEYIVEDLSVPNINKTKEIDIDKHIDNDVTNCQTVLGGCIMSEEEKCVCKHMKKTISHDYDFTPIETESINMHKLTISTDNYNTTGCCNNNLLSKDNMPAIQYKTDGTIKIKEFSDIDFSNDWTEAKFVPFNSCKDVLGRCIVSGNGTIDDGCLCAKMIVDQQVTAQEIEDITPHPVSRPLVI